MIGVLTNRNSPSPEELVDCSAVLYVVCFDGDYLALKVRLKEFCNAQAKKFHIMFIIPFPGDVVTAGFLEECGRMLDDDVRVFYCVQPPKEEPCAEKEHSAHS